MPQIDPVHQRGQQQLHRARLLQGAVLRRVDHRCAASANLLQEQEAIPDALLVRLWALLCEDRISSLARGYRMS